MTDFIRRTTTHGSADGSVAIVESTITGEAIRVGASSSELAQFAALGLSTQETAVLFFTPDTYGERPAAGDVVTWESVEWTVQYVAPIAPDGVTIAARCGVSR